jgi:hypothetical protein
MRILNSWWYLPSFLVGILFVISAIHSLKQIKIDNYIPAMIAASFSLFIGLIFFLMSLSVGSTQKKAHEAKERLKSRRNLKQHP